MASRIPLPENMGSGFLKGIDTGSQMFSRLMAPVLHREQQKQADDHFKKQYDLSKLASSRAAQAAADNHKIAMNNLDPSFQAKQWEALQNYIMNKSTQGQPNTQGQMPPQEQMPNQEFGEGLGMFNQDGLEQQQAQIQAQQQQAQQQAQQPQPQGGINMDLLRQNPMLRGAFKQMFKYDPLAQVAQTPEEKMKASLDLFKQKEEIKSANKTGSGENLTAPIKTKYQNVIGGVSTSRPILKKLIEETKKGNIPGQAIGSLLKRDSQASYKGEISTLLDGVRNAYTIPNTDSGTAKAEDKVLRKSGESDSNYAKRLQGILDQMDYREKDARLKLNSGNITTSLVHLVGPDGEDYDVPSNEVDAILAKNPGVRRG